MNDSSEHIDYINTRLEKSESSPIVSMQKINYNDHLKFRVWDEVNLKFYSQEVLNALPLEVFLASKHIQRYVGVKDCNGKDIFEGDIIKVDSKYHKNFEEVVFKNGSFGFHLNYESTGRINADFDSMCYYNSSEIEVIGNIFEPADF